MNGRELGESDGDGIYHLFGMKTGHYELSAAAPRVGFDGTKVKITPNTPRLPDLVASRCVSSSGSQGRACSRAMGVVQGAGLGVRHIAAGVVPAVLQGEGQGAGEGTQ